MVEGNGIKKGNIVEGNQHQEKIDHLVTTFQDETHDS